ncbi:cytochrome P450 [Devosia pacifica]|uniref:Cytochrome P450 n=1 Tax=Devosia pacifica TaxID=1335967 RepID=A0A918VR08_9HYPH|nr:cytochrome P450 [Devosia pacifica]GHA15940.1 cytochrome P450 [Devosia pacifica]
MTAVEAPSHEQAITPTGPKGLPVLGHMLEMGRDTLGFLERSAREHGDVTALRLATFPAILVNNPDLIEQVLVKQHTKFTKNRVFWRQLSALLGNGLFTAEDSEWQRQRKLAAPAFATRPLESYAPHMVSIAEKHIGAFEDGAVIDMHREMMALGLLIAAQTLLDADVSDYLDDMEKAAYWVIDEVAARFSRPVVIPDVVPLPGHIRYRRGIDFIEKMVYRIIAENRAGKGAESGFLALLMGARDENGQALSDKQLRDEICNMLLAGYETSALSIAWGFHLLGQHRDIQDRIAAEVKRVVGDRSVTHEDLPNLVETEHAVIEILRLLPPGWAIGREAREDVRLGAYHVPKGTTVILSPWVTQRDARNFEDPLSFKPERWAGDFRRKLPRFAYFPFGGGPRVCIGNRFAMMEAMLLLATIVQRFDVERLTDRPVKFLPSITLRPQGGIWVRLNRRR